MRPIASMLDVLRGSSVTDDATDSGAALVAGADGGIGRACTEQLAAAGWRVFEVDRDRGFDITRPGEADRAVAAAQADLGPLDAIVHAIGMSGRRLGDGPVTTCTDEAWEEVLRVNLTSVFHLQRSGIPALRERRGAFVTVGSVLAHATDEQFLTAAYAASKGAIVSLSRVAAREAAPLGVRVNVVAAGLVDTPMAKRATSDRDLRERLTDLQPLGAEPLDADDIAAALVWLVSPGSARITGATLPVDGGWMLR